MEENTKNNKKKIIIIVSVIAGVILIGLTAFGVVKLIEGGKKIAKEVDKFAENIEENNPVIDLGDKIDEIVSNVSDDEEETEKATEEQTEVVTEEATEEVTEPETEAPTKPVTEAPTEAPTSQQIDYANVDWWAIMGQVMEAGNCEDIDWSLIVDAMVRSEGKDESDREIILNEYKKADNFDSIDWNAKDTSFVGPSFGTEVTITTTQPAVKPQTKPLTLEDKLMMDELADENGFYNDGNSSCYVGSLKGELMPTKNQWIKDNFGTSFTHNGVEFGWDEENGYYWINKIGEIHYMTSTSTYRTEYNCRKVFSYRIADYLGFYGTDSTRYHSEASLNDSMFLWDAETDFATVTDVYANNFKYLSELGWVEAVHPDDDISRSWTLESPEGIPAYMYEDGHLAIYVLYPGDEKEKLCYFTIEEYNELVQNNNWRISSYSFSSGFEFEPQENWQKHIKKYVIIE